MDDHTEFLDMKISDVKIPKLLPEGFFKCVVTRATYERQNNAKHTPYVMVSFKPVEVVDADEDVDIGRTRPLNHKFWRTENADQMAVDFLLNKLGLDADEETTFGQLWEEAINCEVIVKTRVGLGGENKDRPFVEAEKFLKIE